MVSRTFHKMFLELSNIVYTEQCAMCYSRFAALIHQQQKCSQPTKVNCVVICFVFLAM